MGDDILCCPVFARRLGGKGLPVRMRLSRGGGKKNPFYHVVVADGRMPRDGRYLDAIGRYDPRMEPSLVEIDADKARLWLDRGAQPSNPVQKLLVIAGVSEPKPKPARSKRALAKAAAKTAAAKAEVAASVPVEASETAPVEAATAAPVEASAVEEATVEAPPEASTGEEAAPEPAEDAADEAPEAAKPPEAES